MAEALFPKDDFDETIDVTLRPNHSYKAIVCVECEAIGRVTGETRSSCYKGDDEYVKLDSVEIGF